MSKVIGLEGLEVGDTIVVGARGTARIAVIADDAEMLAGCLQMRVSEAKREASELPPDVKWFIEKSGQVTITFVAKPIETAPKDKCLYLYDEKYWQPGHWLPERGMESQNCWINSDACEVIDPTHWCYPHEMEVPNELV